MLYSLRVHVQSYSLTHTCTQSYAHTLFRWTMLHSLITMATNWGVTTLSQFTVVECSIGTTTLQPARWDKEGGRETKRAAYSLRPQLHQCCNVLPRLTSRRIENTSMYMYVVWVEPVTTSKLLAPPQSHVNEFPTGRYWANNITLGTSIWTLSFLQLYTQCRCTHISLLFAESSQTGFDQSVGAPRWVAGEPLRCRSVWWSWSSL